MQDFDNPDEFPPDPIPPPPPESPTEAELPVLDCPPLPDKVNVGIVVFTYDGWIRDELRVWSIAADRALGKMARVSDVAFETPKTLERRAEATGRINNVFHAQMFGYGAERVRNKALADSLEAGIDFLLMLDNDMYPDFHSGDKDQVPFLPAALEFALEHDGPCLVGAPYCSGGVNQRVLVSRFTGQRGNLPDGASCAGVLECFSRAEAAERRGMELVPCLPTGCILVDTRVARLLSPPWFYYEYKDAKWTEFSSTEDTTFTRNLFYLGIPSFVAWQSWAAHIKDEYVGRPRAFPQDAIPRNVRKAWEKQGAKRT